MNILTEVIDTFNFTIFNLFSKEQEFLWQKDLNYFNQSDEDRSDIINYNDQWTLKWQDVINDTVHVRTNY